MALLKALCATHPGKQAAVKGDAAAALEALMRLHPKEKELQTEASELVALLRSKGGKGGKEAKPSPLGQPKGAKAAAPKGGGAASGRKGSAEVVTAEYLY